VGIVVLWASAAIDGGNDGQLDSTLAVGLGPGSVRGADRGGLALPVAVGERLDAAAHALADTLPLRASPEAGGAEVEGQSAGNVASTGGNNKGTASQRGQQPLAVAETEALICSYSWPCEKALAVAMCESTMNPAATNGISWGLYAINSIWAKVFTDFWDNWWKPAWNVARAFRIWLIHKDFSAWECN